MGFQKGHKRYGGREKGVQSKTTVQAKELILKAIGNQTEYFDEVMNIIKVKNPTEWARLMVKMFDFVIPKHVDIKSDGQALQAPIIQLLPPANE